MAPSVKIGEFRNRLSTYLRKVRQGSEVIISDRDTPIGRLIPFRPGEEMTMIEPAKGFQGLGRIRIPRLNKKVDAVEELLRDRRKR